jgi:hypothetical protein
MSGSFVSLRLRLSLLLLVLLFAAKPRVVSAQLLERIPGQQDYPGVDIQAALGWKDMPGNGPPLPVSMRITNQSADVLTGRIVLRNAVSGEFLVLGEAALGPGSVRHFGSVVGIRKWEQCELWWESAEGPLWGRQLVMPAGVAASSDAALLFVEDSERRPVFPALPPIRDGRLSFDPPERPPVVGPGEPLPDGWMSRGTDFRTVLSKPWQMPVHPGPLTVFQTVLLSPLIRVDDLTDRQWQALAQWVALGGTVLIAAESAGILERLCAELPCKPGPPNPTGLLGIRRCGGGTIEEYAGGEFGREGTAVMQVIAERASTRVKAPLFAALEEHSADTSGLFKPESPWSDFSALIMMVVFGLYAAASAIPLLMFRATRRRIVMWLLSVVGGASVAAVAVGFVLQRSPGDVQLTTVTQIGEGCLVQTARLQLTSAGRQSPIVGVRGSHPDLQVDEWTPLNVASVFSPFGPPRQRDFHWPPFHVAPAEITPATERDTALRRLRLEMGPWNRRSVTGVDFLEIAGGLEVRLRAEGEQQESEGGDAQFPTIFPLTTVEVQIQSSLPFDLRNCVLRAIRWERPNISGGSWMLYRATSEIAENVDSGDSGQATVTAVVQPSWEWIPDGVAWSNEFSIETERLPKGEMEVWLEGTLIDSPIMKVVETAGDFKLTEDGRHVFLYRIPRENLPASWRRHLDRGKSPN